MMRARQGRMLVCKEEHAPEMKVCRLEGKASHSCWYHAKIEAHFDASRLIGGSLLNTGCVVLYMQDQLILLRTGLGWLALLQRKVPVYTSTAAPRSLHRSVRLDK